MADSQNVKYDHIDHIVRTKEQWDDRAIANYAIPRGVLCIELTSKTETRLKIGEGDKFYKQLPYVGGDSGDLSNYYTKQEVDNIIANLNFMSIASTRIYDSKSQLPLNGNKLGDLRFVRGKELTDDPSEYLWNGNKWIQIGGYADIDLSKYVTREEIMPRIQNLERSSHTHSNKSILDQITAAYTTEEKTKLAELKNYDDTKIKQDISALQSQAHAHINKSILDQTTAPFTREEKQKLEGLHNYDDFVGTDGTQDGRHGLVPAPQTADANKYLSSDGTWKSVSAEGIEPATKSTIGVVIIGTGVDVEQDGTISVHTHPNKSVLDDTTAAYTTEEKSKLAGLENYTLPTASSDTLGGVKIGDGLAVDEDGNLSAIAGITYTEGNAIEFVNDTTPSTIQTDLSGENWQNIVVYHNGSRDGMDDSKTLMLMRYSILPGTEFRVRFTSSSSPPDTVYFNVYAYVDGDQTSGGVKIIPNDSSEWSTDQNQWYTIPDGKHTIDFSIRLNDSGSGSGSDINVSKFSEMILETRGESVSGTSINVKYGKGLQLDDQGRLEVIPEEPPDLEFTAGDGIDISPGVETINITEVEWVQGSIDPNTGIEDDLTTTVIRSQIIETGLTASINVSATSTTNQEMVWKIMFYDSNENFISGSADWNTLSDADTRPQYAKYMKILLKIDDSTTIDDTDLQICEISYPSEDGKIVITNTGVNSVTMEDNSLVVVTGRDKETLVTFGTDFNVINGNVSITDFNRLILNVEE